MTSRTTEREVWRCEVHNDGDSEAGIELTVLAVPVAGRAVSARWRIIERKEGERVRHEGEPVIGFNGAIPYAALHEQAMRYCATAATLHGDEWCVLDFRHRQL